MPLPTAFGSTRLAVARSLVILLTLAPAVIAQERKSSHVVKFEGWRFFVNGQNQSDAQSFLLGFLNGVFAGVTGTPMGQESRLGRFLHCAVASNKISLREAVEMMNKYFTNHPEDWQLTMGEGITKALTVKGSPCEDMAWFEESGDLKTP